VKKIIIFVAACLLLSSCGGLPANSTAATAQIASATPQPGHTPAPTATPFPTATAVPTATATPTPEVIQIRFELPEKIEDLQEVKLDEVADVYEQFTAHYNETGWPVQWISSNGIDSSAAFDYLPTDIYNFNFWAITNIEAHMFRVNGTSLYLIVIPGMHARDIMKLHIVDDQVQGEISDRTVFCFLYNPNATKKFVEKYGKDPVALYDSYYSPDAIFTRMKSGTVVDAAEVMRTKKIRQFPVIDEQGWRTSLDIFIKYPEISVLDMVMLNYYASFYDQATRDAIFSRPLPVFDIQFATR
jgi:hypothetical protein